MAQLWEADGESAGVEPWEFTSILEEATNDFSLQAGAAHNGSYGYRASFGNGQNESACGRIELGSDYSELYIQFGINMVQMDTLYPGGQLFIVLGQKVTYDLMWVKIKQISDEASDWGLHYRIIKSVGYEDVIDSSTLWSGSGWHKIDIYLKATQFGGDGGGRIWLDGVLKGQNMGYSTKYGNTENYNFGASDYGSAWHDGDYFYLDDMKIHDAPFESYHEVSDSIYRSKHAATRALLLGGF